MSNSRDSLKILVVEDQHDVATNIIKFLEGELHTVDYASNGLQAVELALEEYFDLIILDLNLPGLDGIDVCKQIREKADRHIPILMLTARDSLDDKVDGFTVGADDYLTKPFALQELGIRCIALSRRHLVQSNHKLTMGELTIDRQSKRVYREKQEIELHSKGYAILLCLAEAFPKVVSRSQLCFKLWGDEPTESDAIRSHIYQLRSALDKPFSYSMIKTLHGVGFVLDVKNDDE